MTDSAQPAPLPADLAPLVAQLYASSRAASLGLSSADFSLILCEVCARYLPLSTSPSASIRELLTSLKIDELALARACALGHESAWDAFLNRYRARLYEIAGQIAREDSAAHELADSLYADLYGTTQRDGRRISKLASYTGRGSLEGWLRTVLAQEFVNRYRRTRRLVSLDEESEDGVQFASAQLEPPIAVDPRLEASTTEALASLPAEDRYVLAAYYLDGRTLADIARTLGVHESTISRKLDKLARSIRKQIVAALARRGMSRRQAEEALQVDVRDITLNLKKTLVQDAPSPSFSKKKVEAQAGDGPA